MFQVWQMHTLAYQAYSLEGETDEHMIDTPDGWHSFGKTEKASSSTWDLCLAQN